MNAKTHLESIVKAAEELREIDPASPLLRHLSKAILDGVEGVARTAPMYAGERLDLIRTTEMARAGTVAPLPFDGASEVTVRWRDRTLDSGIQATRLSPDAVRKATFDGSTEGRTAAAHVVKALWEREPEWHSLVRGPVISIIDPAEWAGDFQVSASRTVRNGQERMGFLAYPIDLTRTVDADVTRWMTPPDQVFDSFSIISSPYGDVVGWADITAEQEEQAHDLRERFDDGTLHDRGRIVHDKVTDSIGVNLERVLEADEDYPSAEALDEFHRKTGYRAQPCDWPRGHGDEKAKTVIVFVPYGHMAQAETLHDLLRDIEAPKVSQPAP